MSTNAHIVSLALAALVTAIAADQSTAAPVEYTAGHGDIGLAFHDGELELHYHFGSGAILDGSQVTDPLGVEYEPDEAYVRVSDATMTVLGSSLPFLDANSGDSVWVLPQNNVSGLPFLGIASEELSGDDVTASTISLTGFSGPGNFALWQFGFPNQVYWASFDGITPGGEPLNTGVGVHDHFNYGFTAEGVYDVELTASVDLVGGGTATNTGTFRFVVGSSTVVPEPASFGLLAVAAGPLLMVRRRRAAR